MKCKGGPLDGCDIPRFHPANFMFTMYDAAGRVYGQHIYSHATLPEDAEADCLWHYMPHFSRAAMESGRDEQEARHD
jgi:hypothetical protein